jgi:hypothetical protein
MHCTKTRAGVVQFTGEHKRLTEDDLMAWKELSSNVWNLTQPFQYKWDKTEGLMQDGCFHNKMYGLIVTHQRQSAN